MIATLNPEQQTAVLADEKRVLVLAGAGSGKTRTLVERVAHLMENGVSGYEIVCTTFTRAAAGEMRARLEARIGREARKVTVSTFHGLGLGLLKRYGQHIGLRYGALTVYTRWKRTSCSALRGTAGLYAKGKWKHGKRELDAFRPQSSAGKTKNRPIRLCARPLKPPAARTTPCRITADPRACTTRGGRKGTRVYKLDVLPCR